MRQYICAWVATVCLAFGQAAQACHVEAFEFPDVDYADIVVTGRISNYHLVPNTAFAESVRARVETGTASEWERQKYLDVTNDLAPGGFYGQFDIAVEKVLKGRVGKRFSATFRPWTMCCFGSDTKESLPTQLGPGRYFIALQKSESGVLFGNSAAADLPTVHISECIGAFLMKMPDATWFEKDVEKYLAEQRAKQAKPSRNR